MTTKPRITQAALREIEAIRLAGCVNMFDRNAVASIAHEIGADELATFAATRRADYGRLIMEGPDAFEIVDDVEEDS